MAQTLQEWRNLLIDRLKLLRPSEWDRALKGFGGLIDAENDPNGFVDFLENVDRRVINGSCPLLTKFQRNEIRAGRESQLLVRANGTRMILLSKIGEGGQGDVFSAVSPAPAGKRELVALKFVAFSSPDEQVRFDQECQILCAHRAGDSDGSFVVQGRFSFQPAQRQSILVMDWVNGETLQRHVDRRFEANNRLSLWEILDTVESVARGIRFLHRRGLVHRDLKPANILIDAHLPGGVSRPIVVDLGLVKDINNALSIQGFRCGTLYYSAPECFIDASKADEKADIFSLAAVTCFMLTGKPPKNDLHLQYRPGMVFGPKAQKDFDEWSGLTGAQAIYDLKAIRPDLPSGLCQLLSQNLSAHPMNRLGSVDAFLDELRPLRDGLVHIRNVHRVLRQLQLIFRNAIRQCCEDCDTQPVDVNFRELYRSLSGVIRGRFQLNPQFSSRCAISESFSGAREFNSAFKLISEKFVDVVDEVHRIADDPASGNAPTTDQHFRSLTAWQNFLPQLLVLEQKLLIIMQGLL